MIGDFDKGKIQKGFIRYSNKHSYIGEFKDKQLSGHGFYIYDDGKAFLGSFKEGEFHGDGKYFYDEQEWDESSWVKSKRDGTTNIKMKNGKMKSQLYDEGVIISERIY